jgi:hypothetical protein
MNQVIYVDGVDGQQTGRKIEFQISEAYRLDRTLTSKKYHVDCRSKILGYRIRKNIDKHTVRNEMGPDT